MIILCFAVVVVVVLRRITQIKLSLGLRDSEAQISKFEIEDLPYFLRARDSETLVCNAEISRLA